MEKTHRLRVLILASLSMLAFAGIEARLAWVQLARSDHYLSIARSQQSATVSFNRRRGDILDRNGRVLATSTFRDTIYFNPRPARQAGYVLPPDLPSRLARILDMPEMEIRRKLRADRVIMLARKVPTSMGEEIEAMCDLLNVPGGTIFSEEWSKRLYPQGALAGQIIGFTRTDGTGDNIGQAGLEMTHDAEIRGEQRSTRVMVNNMRQSLEPVDEAFIRSTYGRTLQLTIDGEIQHHARAALIESIEKYEADDGAAVVMDVRTGAILAMVSYPDFDPNHFSGATASARRNRVLTDPIEVGSVMKILTSTILMDNDLLTPDELVDCEGGRAYIEGRRFTDSHHSGVVPFRVAFAESSNVAAAKLGLRLEPPLYYESLRRFGLGSPVGIDLPGEGSGILRPVSRWTKYSRTSLPVGYETSLTALQVVSAIGAIGNQGRRMRPHVVARTLNPDGTVHREAPLEVLAEVARPEVCASMLDLMKMVVESEIGTGKGARVPGYDIGGKTGTTRKVTFDGLRHYIGSFGGLAPIRDPRIAVYVYVNEPNHKIGFYGGTVAAPVFSRIVEVAMRVLDVPPDHPEELEPPGRTIAEKKKKSDPVPPEPVTAREFAREAHSAARLAAMYEERPEGSESLFSFAAFGSLVSDPGAAPSAIPALFASSDLRIPSESPVSDASLDAENFAQRYSSDLMPDCIGLTMVETLRRLDRSGVKVRIEGSGIAIKQSPPPGLPVDPDLGGVILFAHPSQRIHPDAVTHSVSAAARIRPGW